VQFWDLEHLKFLNQQICGQEPARPSVDTLLGQKARRREPRVDIPPYEKLRDVETWAEEKPPAGTLYDYSPRGDVTALFRLSGIAEPRRADDHTRHDLQNGRQRGDRLCPIRARKLQAELSHLDTRQPRRR
jgi:hypothetical protein